MVFPTERVGEVARTTYQSKGVPGETTKLSGVLKKRNYIVRAECSASSPGVTMTYVMFDSRLSRPALGGRVQASAEVSCDGTTTVRSAPPLVGESVQLKFTNIPDQVARAALAPK